MTTGEVPGLDPRLAAAREYVMRGWRVFVLNADKTPLPNCPRCPQHNALDQATELRHDAEVCDCLTCHGFYAATGDLIRIELMLERHPHGMLAVRTGVASGVVVIDAEASRDNPGEPTGVEVLDDWESWASTSDQPDWGLPATLRQRTSSGGVHLVYRLPAGVVIKSRNRVLPSVDVKAEGGYVVVPPGAGREWLTDLDAIVPASPELLAWLHGARGRGRTRQGAGRSGDSGGSGGSSGGSGVSGASHSAGYDFNAYIRDGCPAGCRDEFVNEFVFRLRTASTPRGVAEAALRQAWGKMHQPADNEYTWNDCLSKIDHVYRTVQPDGSDDGVVTGSPGPRPVGQPVGQPSGGSVAGGSGAAGVNAAGVVTADLAPASHGAPELPNATGTSPDNPHRNTDRANGIEVARFVHGRAAWVPELGWHVYDGTRWVSDEVETHVTLVGRYVDGVRQLVVSGVTPEAEAEVHLNRVTRLEAVAGLNGALRWARTTLAVPIRQFDTNPWVLNCPNGTLDLRTGTLRQHDPGDLLTRVCPTPYDPGARDEVWERVITELLPDPGVRGWLQRFAGYCLTGDTREKTFLVAHGPRDTGKSTIAEAVLRTVGDVGTGGYGTVWSAEVIQNGTNVNRTEKLSKSRAARLVVVGELQKGSRMADEFVKQYTGGETMDAKELYHASYSFTPSGKLWMATNYVPSSPDPALQSRLCIVPFTQQLARKDPGVRRHLDEDPGAHAAILAWAVRGVLEWAREDTLGDRHWLALRLAEYALDSDPILQFLADECVTGAGPGGDSVAEHEASPAEDVWLRYQLVWAPANVRRPLLKRKFEAALREHGFEKVRVQDGGGRQMQWEGLRLRTQGDDHL